MNKSGLETLQKVRKTLSLEEAGFEPEVKKLVGAWLNNFVLGDLDTVIASEEAYQASKKARRDAKRALRPKKEKKVKEPKEPKEKKVKTPKAPKGEKKQPEPSKPATQTNEEGDLNYEPMETGA